MRRRSWIIIAAHLCACDRAPAAPVEAKPAPAVVEAAGAAAPPAAPVEVKPAAALLEDAEALAAMPTGAAPALKLGGGRGLAIEQEEGALRLDDGVLVRDVPASARAFAPLDEGASRTTFIYEGDRHVATLTRAEWEPAPGAAMPPEVPAIPAEATERVARFEAQDGELGAGRVVRLLSQPYEYVLTMREGTGWPLNGLTISPLEQHTCVEDEDCPRRLCDCGGELLPVRLRCGEESLCTAAELPSCETICDR